MFHFVPRKVALRTRPALSAPDAPVPGSSSTTRSPALTPDEAPNRGTDAKKPKGKNKATHVPADEDLAVLLTLSLSDHALWSNVDLRRAISENDDGWIPLSFLVQQSTHLLHLEQGPPESVLVRAIRSHAEDLLDVRMRVTAPSKDAWYGKDPSTSNVDGGGYEVRLKHTADALARARNSARNEWEARTVYVENVPLAHRTVPGIHRFLSSLLPVPTPRSPPAGTGPELPVPRPTRIQAITLPPHHLDRPGVGGRGAPMKCKGFALVTFASAADAMRLAADWPWLPRRTTLPVPRDGEGETEVQVDRTDADAGAGERTSTAQADAVKFGFRALPKARWDALKDEYLEHRQRLLDELARADAEEHPQPQPHPYAPPRRQSQNERHADVHRGDGLAEPASSAPPRTRTRTRESESDSHPEPPPERATELKAAEPQLAIAPSAPYPPGCLVFVRNVHPETNKTTLKALFGAHAPPVAAALDYVDYAKGMASCHVRLSTPTHARALVSALAARPLAQTHGLDVTGTGSASPPPPLPPLPPSTSPAPAPSPAPNSTPTSNMDTDGKPITAELVDGEREALYWHKVPEKVRREAVRRAIALATTSAGGGGEGDGDAAMAGEEQEEDAKKQGKRARKRRRKA